jgi:serine protease Do
MVLTYVSQEKSAQKALTRCTSRTAENTDATATDSEWNPIVMAIRLVLAICIVIALPSVRAADLPTTIQKIKPSVVGVGTVEETRAPQAQLLATGFAVADGRHVLTNAHVVARELNVKKNEYFAVFVGTGTRPEVRRARKVEVDNVHDMALLEISGMPLPVVHLGRSDHVREGQRIAFTGFPIGAVLGLYPATARGIVSAITPIVIPAASGKQLTAESIERMRTPYMVFQLDATAYPGNSGSPLFDPKTGQVLGVVNMTFVKGTKENALTHPSGISYAIPIRYAEALLTRAGLAAASSRASR